MDRGIAFPGRPSPLENRSCRRSNRGDHRATVVTKPPAEKHAKSDQPTVIGLGHPRRRGRPRAHHAARRAHRPQFRRRRRRGALGRTGTLRAARVAAPGRRPRLLPAQARRLGHRPDGPPARHLRPLRWRGVLRAAGRRGPGAGAAHHAAPDERTAGAQPGPGGAGGPGGRCRRAGPRASIRPPRAIFSTAPMLPGERPSHRWSTSTRCASPGTGRDC